MNVTAVSIKPTNKSEELGRPSLIPELLAATGARYSRSSEGLDTILSKIDSKDQDKSIDSIFKMIDYGHLSISDMAPISMFMDGISIYLAYYIFSVCPTAGGQETSTRYVKLDKSGVLPFELTSFDKTEEVRWDKFIDESFQNYQESLSIWNKYLEKNPERSNIPKELLEDGSPKTQKTVERMKRNFAFDRARYFLPSASLTNVMLVQSARGWVNLCQLLLSSNNKEFLLLGNKIKEELSISAPRLIKHAEAKPSFAKGLEREFEILSKSTLNQKSFEKEMGIDSLSTDTKESKAKLDIFPPAGYNEISLDLLIKQDLDFHDNRYAYQGGTLQRTGVRFSWSAIAFAEIRDLNRHRTGNKYCPLTPLGFYGAKDQLEKNDFDEVSTLNRICKDGETASNYARNLLVNKHQGYIYYTSLGTQFYFEHLTNASNFIYEAEIRTGIGSHYKYSQHLKDVLKLWYNIFPSTKGVIIEGSNEPE